MVERLELNKYDRRKLTALIGRLNYLYKLIDRGHSPGIGFQKAEAAGIEWALQAIEMIYNLDGITLPTPQAEIYQDENADDDDKIAAFRARIVKP